MSSCQTYEKAVCASGAFKLLVADSTEPGLVAHYTFDDSRGADSSGHGNHAESAPRAGPGRGGRGNSAWFDGVNYNLTVPHIRAMTSPALTIMFWMYLLEDSTNSYRTILRKAGEKSHMTPAIMLQTNERRLHVRVGTDGERGVVGFDSTAVVPLRRWTHVTYVLKGGAALSLYVNGVKDCPHQSAGASRRAECSPAGGTYAWDEGEVAHNTGPLYVGADPYMSGTAMFFDELRIYNRTLSEREVHVHASDAFGATPTDYARLGCANCTLPELEIACSELEGYHPCTCNELMAGGLLQARAMGWLHGRADKWDFHADNRNPETCDIVPKGATPPEAATGFCCHD